jgi:hypothetical protein
MWHKRDFSVFWSSVIQDYSSYKHNIHDVFFLKTGLRFCIIYIHTDDMPNNAKMKKQFRKCLKFASNMSSGKPFAIMNPFYLWEYIFSLFATDLREMPKNGCQVRVEETLAALAYETHIDFFFGAVISRNINGIKLVVVSESPKTPEQVHFFLNKEKNGFNRAICS